MAQENRINRDLMFKICFMYFANFILKILEINEEIVEISPTEIIGLENLKKPKIFNNFLDFAAVTKSGKIILFEFKKNALRTKDLKQLYNYFDRVHCKKKAHVDFIIITISDKGIISSYKNKPLIFCPRIIKTKTINKQKDLSILRDKFKHNYKLNPYDCSLMIALPLFKTEESEAEITREMCEYIKEKKNCIPADEVDDVVLAMYLNIIEYIDEEKQDELMDMIGLSEKIEGVISEIENNAREDGEKKGERKIIKKLLKTFTEDEVSKILDIEKTTLLTLIHK
ncbi:MAG: hypothetical protein IJ258_06155 [Methanobrevibacter sp.]|uniref:hypothetical protein n=1 Tax=Methanobrevibacter sp. TaxID=66852 RepID=UPI0025D6C20E|nr:hypothetical protein [Methanobrevibacter sp.]MBQ8017673.1 hypothetical protein [Methanobrevibacter sp.]